MFALVVDVVGFVEHDDGVAQIQLKLLSNIRLEHILVRQYQNIRGCQLTLAVKVRTNIVLFAQLNQVFDIEGSHVLIDPGSFPVHNRVECLCLDLGAPTASTRLTSNTRFTAEVEGTGCGDCVDVVFFEDGLL